MLLTLSQLKTVFHDITVDITELDADYGVRNTYPPNGAPAWKIDQNVVFVTVQPVDNIYDKLRDVTYEPIEITGQDPVADETVTYTRVMQVDWVVYGPNSFDLADKIRFGILNSDALNTLADNDIAPLTEIPAPVRAPELFVGQWWERSDVRAYFNVLTTRNDTKPYLESADIAVHTEQGLYGTIEIED